MSILSAPSLSALLTTKISAISAGFEHNLALKQDGTIWSWGLNNKYGLLGDCADVYSNLPVAFPFKTTRMDEIADISAGFQHNIILKKNGTIWVWGKIYRCGFGIEDRMNQRGEKAGMKSRDGREGNLYWQLKGVDGIVGISKR